MGRCFEQKRFKGFGALLTLMLTVIPLPVNGTDFTPLCAVWSAP